MAIELSDALLQRAKAEVALRGCKLEDLIEEGLQLVFLTSSGGRAQPSLPELMKPAQGTVDSGVPDLASNPKRLKRFVRDARSNR